MLACAAAASTPSRARACSVIECERWLDVELAQVGPIPAGETALVLRPVLSDEFSRFDLEESQAAVTVTVTPVGEAALPGEVVAIDGLEFLVWRPGAPLGPDTEFEVVVTIDNSSLNYSDCGPEAVERVFTVTTGAAATVPLVVPEMTTAVSVVTTPALAPDTMVCCDGAHPVDQSGGCGDPVAWFTGTCSAGASFGSLAVTATLDAAMVEAAMGQVGYHFLGEPFAPGTIEVSLNRHEPLCGPLTAVHLMTGQTMTGPELCLGQDLVDMLGVHASDPAPGLVMCAQQPYTCAAGQGPGGELWDSEDCSPWPEGQVMTDGETPTTGDTPTTGADTGESGSSGDDSVGGSGDGGEKGCACTGGGGGGPWGLVVLLAWRRRFTRA